MEQRRRSINTVDKDITMSSTTTDFGGGVVLFPSSPPTTPSPPPSRRRLSPFCTRAQSMYRFQLCTHTNSTACAQLTAPNVPNNQTQHPGRAPHRVGAYNLRNAQVVRELALAVKCLVRSIITRGDGHDDDVWERRKRRRKKRNNGGGGIGTSSRRVDVPLGAYIDGFNSDSHRDSLARAHQSGDGVMAFKRRGSGDDENDDDDDGDDDDDDLWRMTNFDGDVPVEGDEDILWRMASYDGKGAVDDDDGDNDNEGDTNPAGSGPDECEGVR